MGSARRCRSTPSATPCAAVTPRSPRPDGGQRHGRVHGSRAAAMRRALELAATPGVPLGPNPRVGCVLLDADGADVAEGYHRGAGTAARRGRRAGPGRRRAPGARPRSSPSSRATTPAAPDRARRRWSTPAYAGSSSRRPTRTRSPPGERRRSVAPASRSRPGCWLDEARPAEPGLDLRRRARASVRDLEVRHHPRRPQRRRRRHQPVGEQSAGRARRHAPAPGARAT